MSERTSRPSGDASAAPELVTLHVWRTSPGALPRALTRMAVDPRRLRALPGVRFGKLLGTGTGTDFGPRRRRPDPVGGADRLGLSRRGGRLRRLAGRAGLGAHRPRPARIDLRPLTSRGEWSGQRPFGDPSGGRVDRPGAGADPGPAAARRAATFWRAIPPVAAALRDAPGLLARFGVGEAPLGWQGTVSVWRDPTDLVAFAYRHPEHRAAITRTPTAGWYAEELFARFEVRDVVGDRAVLGWVADGGPETVKGGRA